jgi:hypothetical protein
MTLRPALIAVLLLAAPSARGQPDEHRELIAATRAAMAKRSFDEAADACRRALRLARGMEPLERAANLALCGDVESRRERHLEAAKKYAEAARLARPDLRLRRKLLNQRKKEAERAKAENSTALANEVLEADRTLDQVLRRPRRAGEGLDKTLESLAEAAQTYRRDRDTDRAEEALALRALVLVRSQKPDDGLRAAERAASKRNLSRFAALVVHEARAYAFLEKGEVENGVHAAIEYSNLKNPGGRTPILDRACQRYDQENGAGKCTRLEIRMTGEPTFTDFSIGRRKAELSEEDIERVHAQALPALEDCVLDAAKKEPEFYRNVDIELSWVIDAEGRAKDVDIVPQRNKPDIMPCAEARLSRLRYPKVYSRERKNVTIPYHLD